MKHDVEETTRDPLDREDLRIHYEDPLSFFRGFFNSLLITITFVAAGLLFYRLLEAVL